MINQKIRPAFFSVNPNKPDNAINKGQTSALNRLGKVDANKIKVIKIAKPHAGFAIG
jgi:hypothetical protein